MFSKDSLNEREMGDINPGDIRRSLLLAMETGVGVERSACLGWCLVLTGVWSGVTLLELLHGGDLSL